MTVPNSRFSVFGSRFSVLALLLTAYCSLFTSAFGGCGSDTAKNLDSALDSAAGGPDPLGDGAGGHAGEIEIHTTSEVRVEVLYDLEPDYQERSLVVWAIGDHDLDGVDDLAGIGRSATAFYSGKTGQSIATWDYSNGSGFTPVGDINGDGLSDLLHWDPTDSSRIDARYPKVCGDVSVAVFSGKDGTTLGGHCWDFSKRTYRHRRSG